VGFKQRPNKFYTTDTGPWTWSS